MLYGADLLSSSLDAIRFSSVVLPEPVGPVSPTVYIFLPSIILFHVAAHKIALVYAFAVCPYTRARRSFSEIIPLLHQPPASSGEQFEEGVSFLGNNYEKFVELFSTGVRQHYTLNTGNLYYSCLDFYFEIGPEADPVPKSGSIESGRSLYVGMSILFDDDQIPVGMRFYRGDQSDFHMSREAVSRLKEQFGVRGRTVRVADNTLDCAESINRAVESGHGYLFSRPVSRITEEEKDRVLMESGDWHRVKDRNGALVYMYRTCTGKYPYTFIQKDGTARTFTVEEKRLLTWRPALARRQRAETDRLVEKAKACYAVTADIREYGDAARYVRILPAGAQGGTPAAAGLDWDAIERDRALAGYSLVVTSERKMSTRKMYEVISSARHTEESFRIMKSDLDLRPAHSLNTESVLGHFLVCYIAVLLERLFQHCELKDEYSGREIFEFMRSFRVVRTAEDFFNMTPKSAFVTQFSERAKLPLDHLNLTEKQIKKILSYRC